MANMKTPVSKTATMDNAVKGMNMTELTKTIADPKTPAPIRKAAERRLDRLSNADRTAPLSQMDKLRMMGGGYAKKKMAKGGYANCGASVPGTQRSK